jgi:hypothetical protein
MILNPLNNAIKSIQKNNIILFWLGFVHFFIFIALLVYYPFNEVIVLGINSMIKPIKFALSIWIYSWTMAIILSYLNNSRKVKIYSWVAVITMCFEQLAITSQAFRGELSHFNTSDFYGNLIFQLMGIFILIVTLWTAYITFIFIKQKKYRISPSIVLAIQIGLVYFVVFSLFGGYIGGKSGHTVGAADGEKGLWFLNWSTFFGDLRVAHFFGIHSLQIIPLFAIVVNKFLKNSIAIWFVWIFSIGYFLYVIFVMIQAIQGLPFISIKL